MLVLSVLLLAADGLRQVSMPVVAFLGQGTPDRDPVFQRYRSALEAQGPGALRLVHLPADPATPAALDQAVGRAVQAGAVLIVAPTADAAQAVLRHRLAPPCVYAAFLDPVALGLARSLRHPGTRCAGVSVADNLDSKRLELLRDAYPWVRRVAVLVDQDWLARPDALAPLQHSAGRLGLELDLLQADQVDALPALFRQSAAAAQAWYLPPTTISYRGQAQIAAELRLRPLPTLHASADELQQSGGLALVQDTSFAYAALARLSLRVLAGEPPGAIPIQRPRQLRICLRRQMLPGFPMPSSDVIRRADCWV